MTYFFIFLCFLIVDEFGKISKCKVKYDPSRAKYPYILKNRKFSIREIIETSENQTKYVTLVLSRNA